MGTLGDKMEVKIFVHGAETAESQINDWLKTIIKIKIVGIFSNSLYDVYAYGEPKVCNQWTETTVVYEWL